MSIADIARAGGCSPNTWTKVERGEPVQAGSYEKIAAALRVPTELIRNAAGSTEHLAALLDALGDSPAFPPAASLDDVALFDALDDVVGELYRRYDRLRSALSTLTAGQSAASRRPRVHRAARHHTTAVHAAATRTEQEIT